MRYRTLGRTGIRLSELAIGICARGDPDEASATVALAFDRGINAALVEAGDPAAAALLAGALARWGSKHDVHLIARATSPIASNLPSPHVPAGQAYPGRHLRAEAERLLATLGIERLALLQLHAWCPEWRGEGDWLETLQRLRDEGKIAGFGVSLFDHDVESALDIAASGEIDAVQLMYNIFDQGAAAELLPLCAKHDVGVVVRSPLYYGALAPAFAAGRAFARDDWRTDYFYEDHRRETAERVRRLQPLVAAPDRSITDMALRFSLSHPAISTVAVGIHQREHLRASLAALEHGPLEADRHAALAHHKWLCA